MSEAPQPSLGDRLVEGLARALDAIGLDGRRLRWRWARRRATLEEARARGTDALRSARSKHKMCPACRALVPRASARCPECGETLHGVSVPGPGRMLATLFPGLKAASSLIMLANGVLFLLLLMTPDPEGATGGLGRLLGFHRLVLWRYGAGSGYLVHQDAEWFRMLTSLFLHSGLIHFAFNSMALLSLGPLCEELYGPARFWIAYLLSGLAGNVAAQFFVPGGTIPVVGASGSICGLVGLLLAFGMRRGGSVGEQLRASMIQNAFFILIMSLLPGISLLSHAGGFVGGFLIGLVLPAAPERSRGAQLLWQVLALAGVIAVLAAFRDVALRGGDFMKHVGG